MTIISTLWKEVSVYEKFLLLLLYAEKIFIGEKSPRVCVMEREKQPIFINSSCIILFQRAIEFQKIFIK